MATMTFCSEVKRLYSSLQEMVGIRRRRRQLQISEPFNFKRETTILPGLTEDEITVLREKAAASRLGIAHAANYAAYTDTPRRLPPTTSSTSSSSSRRIISGGPLSLSLSPTPPPRLSIPIPIVGGNPSASSRHGSSGESSLRGGCGGGYGGSAAMGGYLQPGGGQGGVKSVSMNDLDLLLFGDPSGAVATAAATAAPYHQTRMGMGGEGAELVMPLSVSGVVKAGAGASGDGSASFSSGMISPLELDDSFGGGGGGRMDWDMEFDFQLGSPVSPLSPAERGRKGFT